MSRAQYRDNTNVSLFPFLAVLLCTMGALLLVLVVMAKVSRQKATEHAQAINRAKQSATLARDTDQARQALRFVSQRKELLDQRKTEAEELLREEQLRLRHIEDHMRRLEDQLVALQLAAAELDAMKLEHHDDRMAAEREVARLQSLIDETRQEIDALKKEGGGNRSYALVPYQGANGTSRRPIYIECRRSEVILQPEGIHLTRDDLEPAMGAGNPLASALRAAREYMLRQNPALGADASTEPYPLIIVRPDGVMMYYRVRNAIESWDSEFGYELVDDEMKLQFPMPVPELASLEMRAIEQARARQRMLAAAAPRAYAASGSGSFSLTDNGSGHGGSGHGFGGHGNGDEDFDDFEGGFGGELGDAGDASLGDAEVMPFQQQPSSGGSGGPGDTDLSTPGQGDAVAEAADESGDPRNDATAASGGPMLGTADSQLAGGSPEQAPNATSPGGASVESTGTPTGSTANGTSGQSGSPLSTTGQGASGSASSGAGQSGPAMPSATANMRSGQSNESSAADAQGSGGTGGGAARLGPQRPGEVPIRRTIQVIVRRDRLSILPDRDSSTSQKSRLAGGKELSLEDGTQFVVKDFVSAVREHVRNWGMAGSGLYWRPVLVLNVGPDGRQRADELTSLLSNSGIDIRRAETARRTDRIDANSTK